MKKFTLAAASFAAALALAAGVASAQTGSATFAGNGNTGFGGPLGNGTLVISDSPTNLNITLNTTGDFGGNVIVFYLDTKAGGINDTSSLTDTSDGGRRAASGFNGTDRSLVTFPTSFGADYALFLVPGFFGSFDILNTPSNFQFVNGNNVAGPAYTLSLNAAQAAQLGINLGTGQSFRFVATLISESAFRSNEAIGVLNPNPSGNPGFGQPITFSESRSYTLVPEPSAIAALGLGGLALLRRTRRA